ncbi:MAG: hypothetical protein M3O70_19380 [Actinomycetota bacterium]|nr:hypothetical protein [Actinomycetota bacterium]
MGPSRRRCPPPITFEFERFYHPYVCEFRRALELEGIDGLLAPGHGRPLDRQLDKFETPFSTWYRANPRHTSGPDPIEEIDFSLQGAESIYNWELFFHIPLLVADRLSKNGRFEDAQRWLHYIFDPTDVSPHPAPARYWKVKPLFQEASHPPETLEELMRSIAMDGDAAGQLAAWRNDPLIRTRSPGSVPSRT